MKAEEPSWLNPQKLTTNPELSIVCCDKSTIIKLIRALLSIAANFL